MKWLMKGKLFLTATAVSTGPRMAVNCWKKVAQICLKFPRFCPQCKAYFYRIPVGDPWCAGVNHIVGQWGLQWLGLGNAVNERNGKEDVVCRQFLRKMIHSGSVFFKVNGCSKNRHRTSNSTYHAGLAQTVFCHALLSVNALLILDCSWKKTMQLWV